MTRGARIAFTPANPVGWPTTSGKVLLSRKILIGVASLLGAAVVVVGALGILRWQADKAAADFADGVQANLHAHTAAAKKDPVVTRATERLDAAKESTKSEALAPRAQAIGPAVAAFLKLSAASLRAEHASVPNLEAAPLGSRLSASYRDAEEKSAKIDKMYDQLELLTDQAVEFYPNFGEAVRSAILSKTDSLGFGLYSATLSLQVSNTISLGRDDYAGALKSLADQRAALERFSSGIKETPLIPATETRRKAIVEDIDQQVAAYEVTKRALEARDRKAILKAIDVISKGSKNDWFEDFTALVNESGDIGNEVSTLAEKLSKAIEEL